MKPVDFLRALGEPVRVHRRYRLNTSYNTLVRAITAPPVHYADAGVIGTLAHYLILTVMVELLGMSPVIGTAVGAARGRSRRGHAKQLGPE